MPSKDIVDSLFNVTYRTVENLFRYIQVYQSYTFREIFFHMSRNSATVGSF